MTINFITKGKKDLLQIYVRLKDKNNTVNKNSLSGLDAISKTGLSVLSENFKKGAIVLNKIPKNSDAKLKGQLAIHDLQLTKIETKLTAFKKEILAAYSNRKEYEAINGKWLYNVISPQDEVKNKIPNELGLYFDFYLRAKKDTLKSSTLKKIQTINKRIKAFEIDTKTTTYLQEVNNDFAQRFKDWSDSKIYHINTYIKTIKVISTVCKHAQEKYNIILHPQIIGMTRGKEMEYKKSINVHLSFAELKKIEIQDLRSETLEIARDWLLISSFTAQRISDFMRFSTNDIVLMEGNKFLDIDQDKTGNPVLIYLNDIILDVMEKYGGNFPPLFSQMSKDSNESTYNKLIKDVCRLSGITNMVTAQLKNPETNRMEVKTLPKYKFVSSHIGRRNYATNYYSDIDVSLLMSATGHQTEKQFLVYVGKAPKQKAKALAKAMRELSERNSTPMKVIKNISSQN
jgi:hypothetical protein